jgi:hypothetical protein
LIAFLQKLVEFHEALTPSEQAILDQVMAAALSEPEPDVQGYGNPEMRRMAEDRRQQMKRLQMALKTAREQHRGDESFWSGVRSFLGEDPAAGH